MQEREVSIFLQARSDSNRLPFKSLIPVNKILWQSFVLRINGKNFKLTVVTSKNKSDDFLTQVLEENNINYFRGSLNNVYRRFLEQCKESK